MLVLLELLKFVRRLQSEKHFSSCIFALKQQFGLSEFTDWWSCQFFGRKICECPLTQYDLRVKLSKDNCAINSPLHYESFWAYCLRQFLQKAQKCIVISARDRSQHCIPNNDGSKRKRKRFFTLKIPAVLDNKIPRKIPLSSWNCSGRPANSRSRFTLWPSILYVSIYPFSKAIQFAKIFSFLTEL